MIKYFVIFTICVLINVTFGLQDDFTDHLWNKFKKTHGKHYLGDNLEAYRYGIFKSNLETIDKHNTEYSMGMHTYRLGINSFADWTFAEFKAKMLGTKLNMTHDKQASLGTFTKLTSTVKLPDEIDWRKEGAVTGVKNQGDCGSCWSFSSTGSLEGAHFRASGKLVSLSEQQLIDCSTSFQNDGCNGGLMDNAFEYLKSAGGIVSEQSYPYQAKQGVCHFNKKNIVTKCTGYVDIPQGDEDALKQAVATIGPVSVAIDVTQEKFMLYKDGIFVDDTCNNDQDSLNHGVLAVGYGKDAPTGLNRDEMNYWIVKNSWGPEWGEQGYIRMARNLNNMCGIASKASYPIVKN